MQFNKSKIDSEFFKLLLFTLLLSDFLARTKQLFLNRIICVISAQLPYNLYLCMTKSHKATEIKVDMCSFNHTLFITKYINFFFQMIKITQQPTDKSHFNALFYKTFPISYNRKSQLYLKFKVNLKQRNHEINMDRFNQFWFN